MDVPIRTIGRTTRAREVAGALVLVGGAVLVGLLTLAGLRPYENLLALGSVAMLAWLVDGTSRRYVGPAAVAFAAGLGITLGRNLGIEHYEHSLVYGGFGLALILVSVVNPAAVRASGAFLLYTGLTVATSLWLVSIPLGWWLAAILALWGGYELVRLRRAPADGAPAGPATAGRRELAGQRAG